MEGTGINNIELPELVVVNLFKNTLIAQTETNPAIDFENSSYKFLGSNSRKITLVVNQENVTFLPDTHLNFISKILEACKMNIADVAIVNHLTKPVIITELKKQLEPTIVILFGTTPADIKLPIGFPQFKPQVYDGCTYLLSPSLDELNKDSEEGKILKSKLWVCLRKLFEV
jgi:hypothetical protein